MKIAVTGASGFVGRHVMDALADHPDVEVVASSRSCPEALPERVRHVALDLASPSPDDYARLGRPDVLIHLAWSGLPNYLSRHHFETELPAQYAFLRGLVDAGLPSMIVAGTCYEYGLINGELSETTTGTPANPYAFAKTALRQQLEFLQATHPFNLTWARLFYSFGSGQAPSSIYSQLSAALARGDEVFPMSGGEQLRDYLPIDDVARSLVALALSGSNAGIVNVCSGKPVSIRRQVEQWLAEHGANLRLDLGRYPYPTYEPMAFWGSREKLSTFQKARRLPAAE